MPTKTIHQQATAVCATVCMMCLLSPGANHCSSRNMANSTRRLCFCWGPAHDSYWPEYRPTPSAAWEFWQTCHYMCKTFISIIFFQSDQYLKLKCEIHTTTLGCSLPPRNSFATRGLLAEQTRSQRAKAWLLWAVLNWVLPVTVMWLTAFCNVFLHCDSLAYYFWWKMFIWSIRARRSYVDRAPRGSTAAARPLACVAGLFVLKQVMTVFEFLTSRRSHVDLRKLYFVACLNATSVVCHSCKLWLLFFTDEACVLLIVNSFIFFSCPYLVLLAGCLTLVFPVNQTYVS